MSPKISEIDISENTLRNRGRVLDILLRDRTRGGNIIWATDSYETQYKTLYAPIRPITRAKITGVNGKLIQPRAAKSREEQKYRTKEKAEVFTPLKIVGKMNMAINWASGHWPATEKNWVDYISERRLEITCGEAPFIAGRYDPVRENSVIVPLEKRVGFLDYKLRVVGEFTNSEEDWLKYAELSLKSSYGYEWQGDNLLIARENILLTVEDFYRDFCENKLKLKSKQYLPKKELEEFARIISWNIWQMDGLTYTIPLSRHSGAVKPGRNELEQQELFTIEPDDKQLDMLICKECQARGEKYHDGRPVVIMDWQKNKRINFMELIQK